MVVPQPNVAINAAHPPGGVPKPNPMTLTDLGWDAGFMEAFKPFAAEGWLPGRIGTQFRGGYGIMAESGDFLGDISGRFRHRILSPNDAPCVGDWVAFERPKQSGPCTIHALLPRRTQFSRASAGLATTQQVLAANIDHVFVVESLAEKPNLRRIERFLTLAWESGAKPHVVLTKSDLCPNTKEVVEATRAIAGNADVSAVSGLTGKGMKTVRKFLKPGRTAVLLGPSGVGKSTLINSLNDDDTQEVLPVRESDQKGRHATKSRELVLLPEGGLIIDTPGLREIQLWEGQVGVGEAFADIEELSRSCRFTNCRHESEPGCAIQAALKEGKLDVVRVTSFKKLLGESKTFESRNQVRTQIDEHRRAKNLTRSLRDLPKHRQFSGDDE